MVPKRFSLSGEGCCRAGKFIYRVYKNKILILIIHFSYPESWGIDVFRPKTTEMLIRYYNKKYILDEKMTELWLFQEKELFEIYLEYFFTDEDSEKKDRYLKHIQQYKHPKQNNNLARPSLLLLLLPENYNHYYHQF